jgi:hypothetical protein
MGTRNLTAVMLRGEYRLAQYGQWDGYPSGQGLIALRFCRAHLATPEGRARFAEQLQRVRFVSDEEHARLWTSIGVDTSQIFVSLAKSEEFNQKWPYFSRDHGAKILQMVADATEEALTTNQIDFAGDSLMCEWAYVIDLDQETLEVYQGFNHEPLSETERFSSFGNPEEIPEEKYAPVRLVATFSLNDLPTAGDFVARSEGEQSVA